MNLIDLIILFGFGYLIFTAFNTSKRMKKRSLNNNANEQIKSVCRKYDRPFVVDSDNKITIYPGKSNSEIMDKYIVHRSIDSDYLEEYLDHIDPDFEEYVFNDNNNYLLKLFTQYNVYHIKDLHDGDHKLYTIKTNVFGQLKDILYCFPIIEIIAITDDEEHVERVFLKWYKDKPPHLKHFYKLLKYYYMNRKKLMETDDRKVICVYFGNDTCEYDSVVHKIYDTDQQAYNESTSMGLTNYNRIIQEIGDEYRLDEKFNKF